MLFQEVMEWTQVRHMNKAVFSKYIQMKVPREKILIIYLGRSLYCFKKLWSGPTLVRL